MKTNEKQVSQLVKKKKKKKISQTTAWHFGSRIHLKFNNKLIIFFFSLFFKDLAFTEAIRNHEDISYLCHTAVTTVEPASLPSLKLLPNFTVNKSRTVQEPQEQQVWIY